MRQLASYCSKSIFQWDPIQVHEALAEDNDLYYCPYAYGYTNYSRRGYCSHPLKAMDLVTYRGQDASQCLRGYRTGLCPAYAKIGKRHCALRNMLPLP